MSNISELGKFLNKLVIRHARSIAKTEINITLIHADVPVDNIITLGPFRIILLAIIIAIRAIASAFSSFVKFILFFPPSHTYFSLRIFLLGILEIADSTDDLINVNKSVNSKGKIQ